MPLPRCQAASHHHVASQWRHRDVTGTDVRRDVIERCRTVGRVERRAGGSADTAAHR